MPQYISFKDLIAFRLSIIFPCLWPEAQERKVIDVQTHEHRRRVYTQRPKREKFTPGFPGDISYDSPSNAPPVDSPRMHSTVAQQGPSGLHYTRRAYASAHLCQTWMYLGKPPIARTDRSTRTTHRRPYRLVVDLLPSLPTATIASTQRKPAPVESRTHRIWLRRSTHIHHIGTLLALACIHIARYNAPPVEFMRAHNRAPTNLSGTPSARDPRRNFFCEYVSVMPTIMHSARLSPHAYIARQTNVHHRTDTTKPVDTSRACTAPQNQGKATGTSTALAPDPSPRILMLPACTSSTTQRKHAVGAYQRLINEGGGAGAEAEARKAQASSSAQKSVQKVRENVPRLRPTAHPTPPSRTAHTEEARPSHLKEDGVVFCRRRQHGRHMGQVENDEASESLRELLDSRWRAGKRWRKVKRDLPVEHKENKSENEKVDAERGNVVHCHLDSKRGRPKKPRYPIVPFTFKQTIYSITSPR
ncbi:hypothetical protein B0H13DRAFT_1909410 [Mycena leptocephala]|nr:hypothetical protein B0H13DRAFT_1909410 [Mycena leptocephala]